MYLLVWCSRVVAFFLLLSHVFLFNAMFFLSDRDYAFVFAWRDATPVIFFAKNKLSCCSLVRTKKARG